MNYLLDYWDAVAIGSLYFGLIALESILGKHKPRHSRHTLIDLLSLSQVALLIKPVVFISVAALLTLLAPRWQGALADIPFWLGLALVFIPDDFMHYWYHRLAHENAWMWPWHRTHHTTPAYQTSIAFRENWLWYWFMPGFWWSGAMVYLGLTEQVILSTAIIGIHNVLLHNGLDIDQRLYRSALSRKIMGAFEKVIQTPSLHRSHHGLGANGEPMGNYGQTLFVWDVLFGTARFHQENRPEKYGVNRGGEEPWYQQLWLPYGYRQPARRIRLLPKKFYCCS